MVFRATHWSACVGVFFLSTHFPNPPSDPRKMTIIVFLVDTSASMQQRAFVSGRSTLLDVAKGAVEFFVKMRQKSPGRQASKKKERIDLDLDL